MTTTRIQQRAWWQFPWEYRESFTVALGLLAIGYLLQLVSGRGVPELPSPINLWVLAILALLILSLHLFARDTALIKWLRSIPTAISAIFLLVIQAIILGTFPQNATTAVDPLGFSQITHSWAFILTLIYMLLNLGLATVNRAIPFQWSNFGFLLNHLGLWLTLACGMLGAGDLQRYTMDLRNGQIEWRAAHTVKGQTQLIEMPFAFKLLSFDMDVFTAKLALADMHTGKIVNLPKNPPRETVKGDAFNFGDWHIEVLDYFPEAQDFDHQYFAMVGQPGNAPAAKVRATNNKTQAVLEGWVSCGSFMVNSSALQLDDALCLGMLNPEPKKFSSQVQVYTKDGADYVATIEVNKPIRVMGWKVYQLSYDERFGRWSQLSVVEVVRDPWLPAVYTGIALMLCGALYIMIKSRSLQT